MPELDDLLHLFGDNASRLGIFAESSESEVPQPYRRLLAHNDHMTVTVEAFHGCPVSVEVIASQRQGEVYCREILLRRTTDQKVVQFGIVRLDLRALSTVVRDEILAERTPLGRVLIEHDVLREVELHDLWQVECGPQLAGFFVVPQGTITYGRTALIHFNGNPALELLEIVSPVPA
jgi:chorismate-pyruvate lyase